MKQATGFTLLEMLVALFVFALAALALVRITSFAVSQSASLDDRQMALIVARNQTVELLTDPTPPALGSASGVEANAGQNWSWRRNVSAIGDGRALRIDVVVTPPRGGTGATLSVYRVNQ